MTINLINVIESVIVLAIFYLFYRIFLRKETFFKLNRIYLLGSLLFSVTIPFLDLSWSIFQDSLTQTGIINTLAGLRKGYNEINEVVIYAYTGKLTWVVIKEYLSAIYWSGVLISSSFFMFGLIRIIFLIAKSNPKKCGNYKIVEVSDALVPFSLFKWIIINPEKFSSEEMENIIIHEKMHAFQLHSFDLIFTEVLVILFWFNPFIYWYRKSIREIHEYLADRAVVENGCDRLDYQQLILSQVSGGRFVGLACRFSYSLSKNRLKMLTMIKSKNISKIKFLLAIPLALIALTVFANSNNFTKVSNQLKTESKFSGLNETTNIESDTIIESDKPEEQVYYSVEVMPKFQGKESDQFRTFINENLHYPEEAQKKGISGRVFIQFDVDKEGNVDNVIVVRGVAPLLDAEALRVTKSSPKWEPGLEKGKPVRVRYTFPIVFALK